MAKQDAFDVMNSSKSSSKPGLDPRKEGSHKVGGRPTKSASEKRTHKITTYLSTNELEALMNHCADIGVQPAVFIRTQALKACK